MKKNKQAKEQTPKLPKSALEFFREQGRIGALKRAAEMTPEQRSEQARKAVRARWAKAKISPTKKSTKGTK